MRARVAQNDAGGPPPCGDARGVLPCAAEIPGAALPRRGGHMRIRIAKAGLLASGAAALLLLAHGAAAKVEGDTVVLGAAVSLTGKYSVNGKNTKDGYDLAVKRINEMGGVKVAG